MFRVLLAEKLSEAADGRLAAGAEVILANANDEESLCRLVGDVDALIGRTHTAITRRVMESGKRLKAVAVAGVAIDKVDVEAAADLGIAVLNRPGAATDAVAEITTAFMLNLLRPIPRLYAAFKAGKFHEARAKPHGNELRTLTVGIVGMGRIGSAVGRIMNRGFGARVLYNDIIEVGPFDFEATPVDKPTIWAESDIVTLHVPLTDLTRGLVTADVFRQMRTSAFLINASRGAAVDTEALTAALQSGAIAGAGLDVVYPEPLPTDHPLFACENCLMTPHVAARTFGGLERMCGIVDDVLEFLREKE